MSRRDREAGAARNGAIQMPGVRPSPAMAPASRPARTGTSSFVVSQSPMAGWKPSSSWNTSNGHSAARARFERRSASVTCGSSGTRSTSPPGTAPPCGRGRRPSAAAQSSSSGDGSLSPSASHTAWSSAARPPGARHRRGTPRSTARPRSGPSCVPTRNVPSCSEPPRKPATSTAPVSSRSAVTSSLRSSPSSAGDQSAWCMPMASDRTPSTRVGSSSTPKVATAGGRPRLVAVAQHPERFHERIQARPPPQRRRPGGPTKLTISPG